MSRLALASIGPDDRTLAELNAWLVGQTAEQRVSWALQHSPGNHALSSSFGAQAAVSLHLVTSQQPEIPVILIDTGYLFPETYRFVDTLTQQLSLNLKIYRPALGREWTEARHGRLWEQGTEGLDRYNQLHKVDPMRRALNELGVSGWFAGLRRDQAKSRSDIEFVEWRQGRWKFHPIADWTDRDVGLYLQRHGLPYHPLWEQGYVSIGDTHTTRRWEPGMDAEDTRFFGLKRECGLHSLL
ncbi:MAG: phosphoadenylyl-sulfate reductase [Rhodanobacter sp.]